MINPIQLEEAYKEFSQNLTKWVPDGIIPVNLTLLHDLGLLKHAELDGTTTEHLTPFFHVIETTEKVTLFNEKFAVWIVPKVIENQSITLTFIALLHANKPHLELVFSSAGVYNTPKYILRILQHLLQEVIDTETIIDSIEKKA